MGKFNANEFDSSQITDEFSALALKCPFLNLQISVSGDARDALQFDNRCCQIIADGLFGVGICIGPDDRGIVPTRIAFHERCGLFNRDDVRVLKPKLEAAELVIEDRNRQLSVRDTGLRHFQPGWITIGA
jgi:hypothetical protein